MDAAVVGALAGAVLLFLGTLVTVWATRGKTQADYKTAMDARIDKRMAEYMDDLEERNEAQKEELASHAKTIAEQGEAIHRLERAQEAATRREAVLYRYTARLRKHIVDEMPPPPPTLPTELVDWFESFEDTDPLP